MVESKAFFGGALQSSPVGPRGLKQREGAFHIGADEGAGVLEALVGPGIEPGVASAQPLDAEVAAEVNRWPKWVAGTIVYTAGILKKQEKDAAIAGERAKYELKWVPEKPEFPDRFQGITAIQF